MSEIGCDGQRCELYSEATCLWLHSLNDVDVAAMELSKTTGGTLTSKTTRNRHHCASTNIYYVVLTTLLASLLCGVSTASLQRHHDNTMETESDSVLRAIRRLDEEQSRQRHADEQRRAQSTALIRDHFPWLLDNASLYRPLLQMGASSGNKQTAAAVFVSGLEGHEDLTDCLSRVSMDATRDTSSGAERPLLFTTHVTSSVCREHAQNVASCSHVLFMDEPLMNAHHSFKFCKKNPSDDMCGVHYIHSMSLKDWVTLRGSWYVQQIVYGDEQCNQTLPSHSHSQYFHHSQELPCWYRAKLKWDQLSPDVRNLVMDYILDKFESWFSAVGLVKHMWKSLQMMESNYNLPVTQCTSRQTDTGSDTNHNVASKNHKKQRYDLDDPEYLRSDYEVKRILAEDAVLYRAARHLYVKQKQVLFNSVLE